MKTYAETVKTLGPMVNGENIAKMLSLIEFAGDPTNNVTPAFLHQYCHDTTNGALYWASTTASSGWKKLSP